MGSYREAIFKNISQFVKINTGLSIYFWLNLLLAYYLFKDKIRSNFKKS